MAYSPNGNALAVGTHGIVIVLLDVKNGYAPKIKLDKHTAAISHLDWSADSAHLQSNCIGYELLFWDIDPALRNAKQTTPSTCTGVSWATQTCILGWGVQGVFDPSMDGTDVNTVALSHSGTLLADGDDFSSVNLFRYPVLQGHAKKGFRGHSSHVTRVKFSKDDQFLFSCGGGDQVRFFF